VPNWQFDAFCLERSLAEEAAAAGFTMPVRPVEWQGPAPGDALQVVAPVVGDRWFDADELRMRVTAKHGAAGVQCDACGVWRWYPLLSEEMPPYRYASFDGPVDVAASPEWFGDGMSAFRQIVVRRTLAELIVAASPRDFRIREIAER